MNPRMLLAVAALGLAGSTAPFDALDAQVRMSAMGAAAQPRNTAMLGGVQERVAGVWVGGIGQLELGPVTVTGSAFRGELTPVESSPALDRTAGEIAGSLRFNPLPWIGVEGGYTVRAFSSAAGYQRWEVPSVGLAVNGVLGHPALRAFARGAYLPAIKVSGVTQPNLGVAAEAGLTLAPPRVPVMLQIRYRLERYDFPAESTDRLEQFDEVIVALGLRFWSR